MLFDQREKSYFSFLSFFLLAAGGGRDGSNLHTVAKKRTQTDWARSHKDVWVIQNCRDRRPLSRARL